MRIGGTSSCLIHRSSKRKRPRFRKLEWTLTRLRRISTKQDGFWNRHNSQKQPCFGRLFADERRKAMLRQSDRITVLYCCLSCGNELQANNIKKESVNTKYFSLYVLTQANEKIMGDVLLQKTFTADYLTKRRVKNSGQQKQYYVKNHHEAIIPRTVYYKIQEEIARRSSLRKSGTRKGKTAQGVYSSKYALTGIMVCNECGAHYRRTTWAKKGKKVIVWRCINRLEHGTERCHESPTLKEDVIQEAIMKRLHGLAVDQEEEVFLKGVKEDILRAAKVAGGACSKDEIEETIGELKDQLMDYVGKAAREHGGEAWYNERMRKLGLQITELKKRKESIREQEKKREEYEYLDREISRLIGETGRESGEEFDNIFIRQMVREIRVISKNRLQILLRTGMVTDVNL